MVDLLLDLVLHEKDMFEDNFQTPDEIFEMS